VGDQNQTLKCTSDMDKSTKGRPQAQAGKGNKRIVYVHRALARYDRETLLQRCSDTIAVGK
jgi:hypothetical protein